MRVLQGSSRASEAGEAVAEATAGWPNGPQMVFVFCSVAFDPGAVARALAARFPGSPVAGCTTAGEHGGGEHANGSVVLAAVWDSSIRWATRLVRDVKGFEPERAEAEVDELFAVLGTSREELEPAEHFAMLVIDGLSMAEERFTAVLADALEGIPLAGGSAGDDLRFERTAVITEQGAFSDAAVVVLGHKGEARVELLKHQHYVRTPSALCITRADPEARVVFEMDGIPAVEAYAGALGLTREALTDDVTLRHPLTFSCSGETYVRSVSKIHDDGSMAFFCGIEEGMVVEVGGHKSMHGSLQEEMESLVRRFGRPDLFVGFNCILRSLEAGGAGDHGPLGEILRASCGAMIGFDTYGEQLNGLHVNQTLVGVAFHEG